MPDQPASSVEFQRDQFVVSTDPARLDVDFIHSFLAERSYWAKNIPRETALRSIQHSLCFGVYEKARQIGFARVITDQATYAYLCDVFILESHRGAGLGKWLVSCILAHPALRGLRKITLVTGDAHGLYRPFGFKEPAKPENILELRLIETYPQPVS